MPKLSSHTRKAESTTEGLYGTGATTEEEEITDIIQIDLSNTVFLTIGGLLFTCAVFLLRQNAFLPVINGAFLISSAIFIALMELYQPVSILLVVPFWNSCITRGTILVWLSIIAMNGFWLAGFISFALSVVVVLSHFVLGAPTLKPVFYDEVTMKPIFDHAPGLKPLFYGDMKNQEESKEEEGAAAN